MVQKHRIRTDIGKDKRVTVEIKQDFDVLEILSLKFTQQDIYSSFCADYGVVCGRISVNDGLGVGNARVSIFVPLSEVDSEDPVISQLYPYTTSSDRNEDGYRYNLLPSRKQHTGHTPTGTFPDQTDILGREEILEVYEKYYKYTVKTNDAGDFMIWGVPLGSQTIHVDVDLSDMGCQSLVPYDFVYEGVSPEKFENGYTFKASNNLDGLPQIVTFEKTIEVYPFWGNIDLCEIGITRTDFDLKDLGIRIEPYSIMMGGSFTDSGKDSVRVKCNVDNQMGEKCSLITGEGDIEAIRFTGEYDKNVDRTLNYSRPQLEAIQLDSQIDENGNFFFRVPMNMRHIITNEFGEQVVTTDTRKGIATRGTYRFRLSLQNDNGSKKQYRGKYLIPQIKEHQLGSSQNFYTDPKSYTFSIDIDEYPTDAIVDISGSNNNGFSNDYFYSFRYGRVYTVSSFISQYNNKGWWEKNFSFFTKDKNESFIGIKEIQPSIEEDCPNNNEYFPINDAVSNFRFKFLIIIILNFLERLYLLVTQFAIDFIVEFLFDISEILYGFKISIGWPINKTWRFFVGPATRLAKTAKKIQMTTLRRLGLVNYPDCYECNTNPGTDDQSSGGQESSYEFITIDEGDELDFINGTGSYSTPQTPISNNINCSHNYDPNFQGSNPPVLSMTIPISGVSDIKNYVIKYVTVAGVAGVQEVTATQANIDNGDFTDIDGPQGGAPATALTDIMVVGVTPIPEQYGYKFIGYSSPYPSENGTNVFVDLVDEIYSEVYDSNNLTSADPKPTSVSGTAILSTGLLSIKSIYFVSELTQTSSGVNPPVETGCQKYDTIYDADGDMSLKAYINNAAGTQTYDYFVSNPNSYSDYPDIFFDGNEDPCDPPIEIPDIVATFSRKAENHHLTNGWVGESWPRRLALSQGWGSVIGIVEEDRDGTASGYSEFADGQYALVAATGRNKKLIMSYSRRKLLGKLMCAGITSYSFGNSWLNGSLYFFQFRRRRGGSNSKYCKDLIYRKEDDNGAHYYYRSTPYYNGQFVGKVNQSIDGRPNYGEILFPTTIMDLGPKSMYIKEICVDPELDVNCSVSKSIGNTSYQDINDLMEYIIASKEVKEQGKLQAKDLFDRRGGGKIDGDIAQLLNFNSQLGLYGYNDEDEESPYWSSTQTLFDGFGPVGVDFVFSEDDEDTEVIEKDGTLLRLCLNAAGNLTETAQDVPYYKWDKLGDGFGSNGGNSEKQEWDLGNIHSTKYQGGWDYVGLMEPRPPSVPAGGDPTENINGHYYDGSILPPIRDCDDDNYADTKIPIGGPFFFYFGLRTGKTSWNKFIKNFGPL
jgi:hypothetical protein